MGTTTVPTTQDFLLLFINSFYTTFTALASAIIALMPTVIQAGFNFFFGLLQGQQPTT